MRNLRLSIDVRGSDDLGLHSAVEVIVAIVPPLSLSISVSTDITELTIGRLATLGRVVYGGGYLTIGGDYHTNVNIGGAAAIPVLLSGGYVAISAFAAGSVFVTLAVSDDHPATPAGFAEFGVLAFNSPLSLDVNHLPRTTITQGGNLNSHLAAQLVAAGGLPPYTYSFSVVNSAGVSWGDGGGLSVSLNNVNIAPDTLFVRATGFVEDAAGDLATVQLTATIAKVLATLQLTFANHQQHIVNDVGNFATLGIVSVVNLPAGALANVKVRYSHLATSGGIYDANLIPQIINGDLFVIVVNTVANGESLVLKNHLAASAGFVVSVSNDDYAIGQLDILSRYVAALTTEASAVITTSLRGFLDAGVRLDAQNVCDLAVSVEPFLLFSADGRCDTANTVYRPVLRGVPPRGALVTATINIGSRDSERSARFYPLPQLQARAPFTIRIADNFEQPASRKFCNEVVT